MSRRRGIMSDSLKMEIAKEMGIDETIRQEGWGSITTKDAGNMVKKAIELAENQLARERQE